MEGMNLLSMTRIKELIHKVSSETFIIENAPMSKYTSFKAGGSARALIEVKSTEELKSLLQLFGEEGINHMMLGNGSNTLFKDSGYDGVVISFPRNFPM